MTVALIIKNNVYGCSLYETHHLICILESTTRVWAGWWCKFPKQLGGLWSYNNENVWGLEMQWTIWCDVCCSWQFVGHQMMVACWFLWAGRLRESAWALLSQSVVSGNENECQALCLISYDHYIRPQEMLTNTWITHFDWLCSSAPQNLSFFLSLIPPVPPFSQFSFSPLFSPHLRLWFVMVTERGDRKKMFTSGKKNVSNVS